MVSAVQRKQAKALCAWVRATFQEQSGGWKKRSLFERQWIICDFRKTAGMSVNEWLDALAWLESSLERNSDIVKPE